MSVWFWLFAIGLVPASIVVMWALTYLVPTLVVKEETYDWWKRVGLYLVPTVAAVVSAVLLLYGAEQVSRR